jgi:hypothetical protein
LSGSTESADPPVTSGRFASRIGRENLIGLGAVFSKVKNWGHTVKDGHLITGQNGLFGPDRQASDRDLDGEIA